MKEPFDLEDLKRLCALTIKQTTFMQLKATTLFYAGLRMESSAIMYFQIRAQRKSREEYSAKSWRGSWIQNTGKEILGRLSI